MERLTEKRDGKNVIPLRQDGQRKWALASAGMGDASAKYLYGEYADRLAAYEDTGLEPEDVLSATDMAKVACALNELNTYKELGPIDHLRELAQAEKDGRLVALKPLTPGKLVWIIERDKCGEPYEIGGYMFLAFVGQAVIVSEFINDYDTLDETVEYHIEKTLENYDTALAVFPKKDCYLTREEAEAALEGGNDE